jgi:hypothetical protein
MVHHMLWLEFSIPAFTLTISNNLCDFQLQPCIQEQRLSIHKETCNRKKTDMPTQDQYAKRFFSAQIYANQLDGAENWGVGIFSLPLVSHFV